MKERPIIFSGPMVKAILSGAKGQTRRVVKNADWLACLTGDCPHDTQSECDSSLALECPYGKPGDMLWVRETWGMTTCSAGKVSVRWKADNAIKHALAMDGGEGDLCGFDDDCTHEPWLELLNAQRWRPSIHMPRWASRLTLRITEIRVERLRDISEEDAVAEGVPMGDDLLICSEGCGHRDYEGDHLQRWEKDGDWGEICPKCGGNLWHHPMDEQYRQSFRDVWHQINGAESWDANPWVWVISFAPLKCFLCEKLIAVANSSPVVGQPAQTRVCDECECLTKRNPGRKIGDAIARFSKSFNQPQQPESCATTE